MDIEFIPEDDVSYFEDYISFKILVIGNSGLEKSAILKKAINKNKFDEIYSPTIAFEYFTIHFRVKDLKIKLHIWDTMGKEIYSSMLQGSYRNISLLLLVYDITDKSSFKDLDFWLKDNRLNFNPNIPIIIAGNKYDLENKREVPYNDIKEFSLLNKIRYFTECSGKTGYNVENIFYEAAKYLYNAYIELEKNKNKFSSNYILNKYIHF